MRATVRASVLVVCGAAGAALAQSGGCCFSTGGCELTDPPQCGYHGGVFLGSGTTCASCGPVGACCVSVSGVVYCKDASQGWCTASAGVFHGAGTLCTPEMCPNPQGACCRPAGCDVLTAPLCALVNGVYQGNNAPCSSCPAPCYANCDGSTTAPVLTVQDCVCFINRFAAGDSRANCDGSTAPPVLNIMDFSCFVSHLGAGC